MKDERVFTKHDSERILTLISNYKVQNPTETGYIENLKQQIIKSKHVDSEKIKENIITINSIFILKNLGTGSQKEYHLTLPDEPNAKSEKLSILSMLGLQVIGNKVGSIVRENFESEKYYMIDKITYQPEAAGDFDL